MKMIHFLLHAACLVTAPVHLQLEQHNEVTVNNISSNESVAPKPLPLALLSSSGCNNCHFMVKVAETYLVHMGNHSEQKLLTYLNQTCHLDSLDFKNKFCKKFVNRTAPSLRHQMRLVPSELCSCIN